MVNKNRNMYPKLMCLLLYIEFVLRRNKTLCCQYMYVSDGLWSLYCGRLSHNTVHCLYSFVIQNIATI